MPRNAKTLQNKAKQHQVIPLDHDTFRVTSGTSGNSYLVRLYPDVSGGVCDCQWGQTRRYVNFYRSGCSHVQAVFRHLENLAGRETSTWASQNDAKRQHRPMVDIGDGIVMTTRKGAPM